MIKISIVTVCYNAETTIEETILSIVNQSYRNVEYIIIDGKSDDNTLSIIDRYKDRISLCVSEPDKGIYDAMNKGLNYASGDFVIFLGADDHLISYDTIEEFVSKVQDLESVYYGDVYRNKYNDIFCGKFSWIRLCVKNICHQSIFYPKSVYKAHQYELKYKIFADYMYNLNLYHVVRYRYVPQTISFFNCSGLSSGFDDPDFFGDIYKIIYKNYGFIGVLIRLLHRMLWHIKQFLIKKD